MEYDLPVLTRRNFLRTSLMGAAFSWTVPVFIQQTCMVMHAQATDSATQAMTGRDHPILVVIQLAGGNDGLNTIIPFEDDLYFKARPTIGIPKNQVITLDQGVGLHPNLSPLKALYESGSLAIVQGVGYPNPNRSHFRSTEIWQTASDSNHTLSEGWLGRYFDNCCSGADPTIGVAIGEETPQAFAAKNPTGVTFARPEQFRFRPSDPSSGQMSAEEMFFRQLNET